MRCVHGICEDLTRVQAGEVGPFWREGSLEGDMVISVSVCTGVCQQDPRGLQRGGPVLPLSWARVRKARGVVHT